MTNDRKLLIAEYYLTSRLTHKQKIEKIESIFEIKEPSFKHVIAEINKYKTLTLASKLNEKKGKI